MGIFTWKDKNVSYEKDMFSESIYIGTPALTVDEQTAMKVPEVAACVNLISSTIGTLPIYLYAESEKGDVIELEDNRVKLLNDKPNKYDVSSKIKKLLVKDIVLYGKAYLMKKDGQLYYLEASKMEVRYYTEDGITFVGKKFTYNGYKTVTLEESSVICFETGYDGALANGSEILQRAVNEQTYKKSVLVNGALPLGILKSAGRLTEGSLKRLKESFEATFRGASNASKTLLLEEGMEYQPLSLKPEELQLTESSKQTLASVCRLFGVPEAMINSASNKYASLSTQNTQFLQLTISPIITVIEETLNRELLNENELGNRRFRFDTSMIIRGDEKELVENTTKLLKDGVISINEARAKLDYSKLNDDYFLLTLNSALKDVHSGEITVVNLGAKIEEEKEVTQNDENGITDNESNVTE